MVANVGFLFKASVAGGGVPFLVGREQPSGNISAQIAYNLCRCYKYCAACRNGDSSTTGVRNGRTNLFENGGSNTLGAYSTLISSPCQIRRFAPRSFRSLMTCGLCEPQLTPASRFVTRNWSRM